MALTKLEVQLEAEIAKLKADLDKASNNIQKWGKKSNKTVDSVKQNFKRLGLSIAAAATAAAAGLTLLTKSSADAIDNLAKVSDKLGIATESLIGLRHAAELTGVASNTLDMALQRMTRRLSEAAAGGGEALGAIKELGLDAQRLTALRPEQAFAEIAEAMGEVENQSDKVRLAFKFFDSEGVSLVNTLSLGRDGLEAAANEAQRLGIAVTRIDAAKVEQANDTFNKIGKTSKGLGNAIAVTLAPYVSDLGERFLEVAEKSGGMANFVADGMSLIVKSVGYVANTIQFLERVWVGLKLTAATAIAAIVTGLDELNKAGAEALNWIPGVDIKPSPALSLWAETARDQVEELVQELADLGNADLSSTAIEEWSERVKFKFDEVARKKAETSAAMLDAGAAGFEAESMKLEENLQRQLNAIDTYLMTKQEREIAAFENRLFIIEESYQNEVISFERRNELIEALEQKHQAALGNLEAQGLQARKVYEEKTTRDKVKFVLGQMGALTQGVAQSSKKLFQINKIAAIGNAIVNTYEGVTKALAAYPPPISFAMAALQAAAGFKQVSAIKGTSFGGGGATVAVSGGTVPTETQAPTEVQQATGPQPQAEPQVNVNIFGDILGDEASAQIISGHIEQALADRILTLRVESSDDRVVAA